MKYTFHVIVIEALCPNTQRVMYHSLRIPVWKIHQALLDIERDFIASNTLSVFLQKFLYDLLEEREQHGLPIDPPRKLNTVLHEILDPPLPNHSIDHHRLHLTIDIDNYLPKRQRCHFFEHFTPLFVGICSSIDLLLLGVLNFSSMQYAQSIDGFWNMDRATNVGVSVTSSMMGVFWSLWQFFSGGEIVFLKDTGAMIDKKCHQLSDWYKGENSPLILDTQPKVTLSGQVLTIILKILFSLALLNNCYQQLTTSYTQIKSLSKTITDHISLPATLFRILQWCELGCEHIDDPFLWATMFYFGFSVIDVLINTRFSAPPAEALIIEIPHDQDEQKTPTVPVSIDEQRISRLSRWSQASTRPNPSHYHPLAAAPIPQPEPQVQIEPDIVATPHSPH